MSRYYTKFGAKRVELVKLMQKFVPWSRIKNFRNECTQSTHWTLNSCLCASHSDWVYLAIFSYYTKLGAKRVELVQLMQKFVLWSRIRIFRNDRTQSTHWTLNSCLCASRSVWVHFGLFRYCTKLGTKWAELVQLMHMFLPRSRIRIFCNERTRSTPLDPKLMFWCVS